VLLAAEHHIPGRGDAPGPPHVPGDGGRPLYLQAEPTVELDFRTAEVAGCASLVVSSLHGAISPHRAAHSRLDPPQRGDVSRRQKVQTSRTAAVPPGSARS